MTEVAAPLAVRRAVCFSEAVYEGRWEVEGVSARLVELAGEFDTVRSRGEVPILVDPALGCLAQWQPHVLVDATLAKRNMGLRRALAPLVVGVGPGFAAGDEVHRVVETNRGHNLGRVYERGAAEPDTGVPGDIAGFSVKRLLRAPGDGVISTPVRIGDRVTEGQEVGQVAGEPLLAGVTGIVRGLLRDGTPVKQGLKVGDVDPRDQREHCFTISEKARAIGGAVLEIVIGSLAR